MNANDLTFGIEIETIAPDSAVRNDGLRIGSYKHGIQVPYLPAGWNAEADGSINNGHGGHKCEIVSPILRGRRAGPGRRGPPDARGQRPPGQRELRGPRSRRLEARLAQRGLGPPGHDRRLRREGPLRDHRNARTASAATYCGGVRKYGNDKDAKPNLDRNRYHALNLTNLARGTKDTVEFRVFSGSLTATKVVGWIQVCLGLVERALNGKRMPDLEARSRLTGGWKKAGRGQSEAERLMGYLAWGKGYARIHGGKQFGWISDAIPQDEIKAEFRRLAKKYDAQA